MKIRLFDVPVGSCYLEGRKAKVMKKIEADQSATIGPGKRVIKRKIKGDKEVDTLETCPLNLFGVGLRRHPDLVVEIGDGNILKNRRNLP